MLFHSLEFLFLFLPLTLAIFFSLGKNHRKLAIVWLILSSLFFYGFWNPVYLWLIAFSICGNYAVGILLSSTKRSPLFSRMALIIGISGNLGLLGYFKYAHFAVANFNSITGSNFAIAPIVLPLAISFFTFQQISYLVDVYKGNTEEYSFLHYSLFVTFFPQLIAGPIVHHREIIPQFAKKAKFYFDYSDIAIGMTIFFLGLFKKVVLADNLAIYANPVFEAAEQKVAITFFEAWGGALAYTLQLYFDFSGYSDMAIGLARLFGICLPMNFNSPYQAEDIIDFWRRWHMTLSRFLRDYLYIPLGGNRHGTARRYGNLLITMLLGGLWHGAGWTFVIWGALHGLYLVINHGWRTLWKGEEISFWRRRLAHLITFLAVVVGWVFFRAKSLTGAVFLLEAMLARHGVVFPPQFSGIQAKLGLVSIAVADRPFDVFGSVRGFSIIAIALFIAFFLPNTAQFTRQYQPVLETAVLSEPRIFRFRFHFLYSLAISVIIVLSLLMLMSIQKKEFLYFDF